MKCRQWQRNQELERGPVAGLAFSLVLLITSSSMGQGVESVPASILPLPATDGLGRALPMPGEVSGPRPDRFVGMFYFLWHDNRAGKRPEGDGPYDISRILARDPDAIHHPRSALWGPIGMYHYWGEPLYGYYQSTDPWVIRRHARLLADAGVDTLIFDTTNTETYPDVYSRLCEVFLRDPQIGRANSPDRVHDEHQCGCDRAASLPRPLCTGQVPRPLVRLAGQAADDLRPDPGRCGASGILHAPQGPLAGQAGQHPLRLALGGDLPAVLRIHR